MNTSTRVLALRPGLLPVGWLFQLVQLPQDIRWYSTMSLSQEQTLELKQSLQQAVLACSERCLYHSARWAAELLAALPNDENDATVNSTAYYELPIPKRDPSDLLLEQIETPKYLMAKSFFDCHEFRRCADTLLPTSLSGHSTIFRNGKSMSSRRHVRVPRKENSQRGLFLASYALLILGEKQKVEDAAQILGPSDTGAVENKQLLYIRSILEKWLIRHHGQFGHGHSQGWLEYLYGVVLAKQQNNDLAISWLLKSIKLNPWNWGAWQELCALVRNAQHLNSIYTELQPSMMAFIFSIYARQELHMASSSLLSDISKLQIIFPSSLFLQGQEALVYRRMNDFASARSVFSEMLVSNPRYLDFLEHYSNVLYNLESPTALAFAAQLASSVDPYRPESCCAIGYFYSMSKRHEDAIIYFRRAVTLDRSCATAWTFLGHKYMDVNNLYAALSSYRRSIGLNRRDYRAFYGLGQAYEALEKPNMALNYYHQAVALHPEEMGLWRTMGNCMSTLSKVPQAISALKRALECTSAAFNNPEEYEGDIFLLRLQRVHILFQSAELYESMHNRREATIHLQQCLDEAIEHYSDTRAEGYKHNESMSSLIPRSKLLIARWALDDGDHKRARHFASQVGQSSQFGEEASRLLNACKSEERKDLNQRG
ncbi:cell division cycle protein-like protein 23 [Xylaria cf. heliscus]|nr:cell division cycle protein-like protein 23 [Xylaria cf. heliscus]